jgi:hypothetical protein
MIYVIYKFQRKISKAVRVANIGSDLLYMTVVKGTSVSRKLVMCCLMCRHVKLLNTAYSFGWVDSWHICQ